MNKWRSNTCDDVQASRNESNGGEHTSYASCARFWEFFSKSTTLYRDNSIRVSIHTFTKRQECTYGATPPSLTKTTRNFSLRRSTIRDATAARVASARAESFVEVDNAPVFKTWIVHWLRASASSWLGRILIKIAIHFPRLAIPVSLNTNWHDVREEEGKQMACSVLHIARIIPNHSQEGSSIHSTAFWHKVDHAFVQT